MSKPSKLHYVWHSMKKRCESPNCHNYIYYGGRGIKLCTEWHSYKVFKEWALQCGYREGLTIDRKDNNGDYEPLNCHWITQQEQSYNKRNNRRILFDGKTQTLAEWVNETGLSSGAIRYRLSSGWSVKDALTIPTMRGVKRDGKGKFIRINGVC